MLHDRVRERWQRLTLKGVVEVGWSLYRTVDQAALSRSMRLLDATVWPWKTAFILDA